MRQFTLPMGPSELCEYTAGIFELVGKFHGTILSITTQEVNLFRGAPRPLDKRCTADGSRALPLA
jgi:hypothetical protein